MQTQVLEFLTGNKTPLAKNDLPRNAAKEALFFPAAIHKTTEIVNTDFVLPHISRSVVVDTPNGKKLVNTCSDQYALIKLENILNPFEALLDEHFEYKATYKHQDHSKFFIDYIIDKCLVTGEPLHEVDKIFPKISIQHSYTGTLKFACSFGFYRLVCSNGMTTPVGKGLDISCKHTKGSIEPTIREMFSGVQYFIDHAQTFTQDYQLLQTKKVFDLPARIEEASKGTGFPQKLGTECVLRAVVEAKKNNLPKTDWLAYNAMNFQLNHNYSTFGMQPADRLTMDSKVLDWFIKN